MTEPIPAEGNQPVSTSPLQTLRERLGSMGNLTQREVDRVAERLRTEERPGRHRR